MSRVRADKLVDRAATGAVELTKGAWVPTGIGFTGDGQIKVGGAATVGGILAVTDSTDSTSSTTGSVIVTGGLGVAKNVYIGAGLSVAGTLTYEDVTNVDSVGLITAKTGLRVTAGGVVVTAGVATFSDKVTVTSTLTGTEGLHVSAGVGTFAGAVSAAGALTGSAGVDVSGGQLTVGSGVTIGAAGIATFSNGIDLNGGNILKEKVNIVAGKASANTNINLSYGQVWHFTTVETECFVPNIMSNVGINTGMEIGDTISVSIATSCAAVSWAATVTVDGASVNEQKWGGGSAPTAGGSSGHDLYTHNVIKTAANTYTVLSNVTNYG